MAKITYIRRELRVTALGTRRGVPNVYKYVSLRVQVWVVFLYLEREREKKREREREEKVAHDLLTRSIKMKQENEIGEKLIHRHGLPA